MKLKWLILGIFLIGLFMVGCGDEITVEPTPVTIDLAIKPLPIDGFWVGTLRDDSAVTWYARWHIGIDGNKRILKGDIDVTDNATHVTQPFPIQKTDPDGIIVYGDNSWYVLVYLTSLWSIRGTLIHPDTMEVNIAGHWPRDLVYKLHRSSSWLGVDGNQLTKDS